MEFLKDLTKDEFLIHAKDYQEYKKDEELDLMNKEDEITSIIFKKDSRFTKQDLEKYQSFCVSGNEKQVTDFIFGFIDNVQVDSNEFDVVFIDTLDEFDKDDFKEKVEFVNDENALEKLSEIFGARQNISHEKIKKILEPNYSGLKEKQKNKIIIVSDIVRSDNKFSLKFFVHKTLNESMDSKVYFVLCSTRLTELELFAVDEKLPVIDLENYIYFNNASERTNFNKK